MNAGDQVHPEADAWVVAIYATKGDYDPLGSGIVIDDRRILTCAHVIEDLADGQPWVAFPKAVDDVPEGRRLVDRIVFPDARTPVKDLAILILGEPTPAGVTQAPLRCPEPTALVSKRWWAFGFPAGDLFGNSAEGEVGSSLSHGWIRLDTTSRYPVERGFSGGGLWSPDYQAVVAVVSHANAAQGDGRAITLYQADQWFPDQKLRILAEQFQSTAAGPLALAAWGWSLQGDSEATRHWRPRARGVSINSELGFRFRGRTAALGKIVRWLDRELIDRRVLVVTGAPGAGKSAVLGRIVTTADKDAVKELPASDSAVKATIGSVACAVHAKGATSLEIAASIAKAASAAIPERIDDFGPALRDALAERSGSRFNVIIDALDEAATSAEARLIVSKVILPLTETCADVGAQVVVGSRRSDIDGDLLGAFGGATNLVDLDEREFFDEEDLAAYALATLQLAGDEREGNPYMTVAVAVPMARRIAQLSDSNFLVAGLTARTHGLYDIEPVSPSALRFSPKVDDAMHEYLRRIPDIGKASAETLLLPLAYAESPGLPVGLWQIALKALGFGSMDNAMLKRFARSSAASFLVESTGDEGREAEYRLFHQALNDALLRERGKLVSKREDERALTRAFLATGQESGWDQAPAYLLRSLPAHAARTGLVDDLLEDDTYLLSADLLRLLPVASYASSNVSQQRARLLRLSSRDVITVDASTRAAVFSVIENLEGLGNTYTRADVWTPYRAAWASVPYSPEQSVFHGHDGAVRSACAFTLGGATLLATASADRTVLIWDPATGTQHHVLRGHEDTVDDVFTYTALDGTALLATASSDGTARIWNPATGACLRILRGHDRPVFSVCALALDGYPPLVVTASADCTVRIWDPATGACLRILRGHEDWVRSVCAFGLDKATLLATASNDRTVRIWDPATGTCLRILHGHEDWVRSVCAFGLDKATLLATASNDRTVRIWDPATGTCQRTFPGHDDPVLAVRAFARTDRQILLATASGDRTVRIWDPTTGICQRTLKGHNGPVNAISAFTYGSAILLATASNDRTVRIWDPTMEAQNHTLQGHDGPVNAICSFMQSGARLVATGGSDGTIRTWNSTTGTQHLPRYNPKSSSRYDAYGPVLSMCAFSDRRSAAVLAAVYDDRAVHIWDPARESGHIIPPEDDDVRSVCAFTQNGTPLLATANGVSGTVRIWGTAEGDRSHRFNVDKAVNSICAFTYDSRTLLATGGPDGNILIVGPLPRFHFRDRRRSGQFNFSTSIHEESLDHVDGHGSINAICAFNLNEVTFLATANNDHTISIWNLTINSYYRRLYRTLYGHEDIVNSVCPVTLGETTFLATGSSDRSVRIWDPTKKANAVVIPTRDEALCVSCADETLFVGTATGVIAIRLDPAFLRRSLR